MSSSLKFSPSTKYLALWYLSWLTLPVSETPVVKAKLLSVHVWPSLNRRDITSVSLPMANRCIGLNWNEYKMWRMTRLYLRHNRGLNHIVLGKKITEYMNMNKGRKPGLKSGVTLFCLCKIWIQQQNHCNYWECIWQDEVSKWASSWDYGTFHPP